MSLTPALIDAQNDGQGSQCISLVEKWILHFWSSLKETRVCLCWEFIYLFSRKLMLNLIFPFINIWVGREFREMFLFGKSPYDFVKYSPMTLTGPKHQIKLRSPTNIYPRQTKPMTVIQSWSGAIKGYCKKKLLFDILFLRFLCSNVLGS